MKISYRSILFFWLFVSVIIFSNNFCFGQKFTRPFLSIRSYSSKREIVVYEGVYIKITVDEKEYKSKWNVVNDSVIKLNGSEFNLDKIDKIKIGYSGEHLAGATIGGLVGVFSLSLTAFGVYEMTQEDEGSYILIDLFIVVPAACLSYFSFKYTFGQIRKSKGFSKDKFKFSLIR